MRRMPMTVAAFLVLVFVQPAPGRAVSWRLHTGAGAAFPAGGALLEGLSTGFCGTLAVGGALAPSLTLLGRCTYDEFPRDDEGTLLVAGIDKRPLRILEMTGGTMQVCDVVGEARYSLSPAAQSVHPFVCGAAGLTWYRYERVDITYAYAGHTWPATVPGEEATAASLAAGGGVDFTPRPWLAFAVEARLHAVLRDQSPLWFVPLWLAVVITL